MTSTASHDRPGGIAVGVALKVRYEAMRDVAVAAEELGYESVWIPEHLVLPADLDGSFHGVTLRPDIPTLDVLVFLATLAVATERIRLGTWVYNLALRHPIVAARAVQTLDVVSAGRVTLGVGAGWLEAEYAAVGVDFATRGRRLDESIDVLRLLWTEETPSVDGEFTAFGPVRFEPKPPQGTVPILVGGESDAALRRAAERGDGWIGMDHTVASAAAQVRKLRALSDRPVEVTVGAAPQDRAELAAYAEAGVDRVIVAPFTGTADATDGLRAYAERMW